MKIIKCDMCGKEMTGNDQSIQVTVSLVEDFHGDSVENVSLFDTCPDCGRNIIDIIRRMTKNDAE